MFPLFSLFILKNSTRSDEEKLCLKIKFFRQFTSKSDIAHMILTE